MTRAEINGEVILTQLPEIISWLVELGLPAANSRFARYHKIIEKFFRDRPDTLQDGGNQRFRDLSLAYRECLDIWIVYTCFKGTRHPNFIEKLFKVVAGQDVPEPGDAGKSRNYLFEFLVAARFQLAGYTIDFDEKTDVVARRDGIAVRVECKRLTSENQLIKRIGEAADQLSKAPTKFGEKEVGLIFVDVSSCIIERVAWEVDTPNDARREVNRELLSFLSRNAAKIETANQRYLDVSYGTCFSATLPIWTRLNSVMQSASKIDVLAAENISEEEFDELHKVLSGIEHSFTRLLDLMGSPVQASAG